MLVRAQYSCTFSWGVSRASPQLCFIGGHATRVGVTVLPVPQCWVNPLGPHASWYQQPVSSAGRPRAAVPLSLVNPPPHHKNGQGRGEIVTFCLDPIKRSLRRDESPRAPLCAASGWKKAEAAFEGEKEVSLLGPLQAFKAGVIALFLNSQIKEAPASFPSR